MSNEEQSPIVRLDQEIEAKIDYFSKEYDLTISETIGILEIIKQRWLIRLFKNPHNNPQ